MTTYTRDLLMLCLRESGESEGSVTKEETNTERIKSKHTNMKSKQGMKEDNGRSKRGKESKEVFSSC